MDTLHLNENNETKTYNPEINNNNNKKKKQWVLLDLYIVLVCIETILKVPVDATFTQASWNAECQRSLESEIEDLESRIAACEEYYQLLLRKEEPPQPPLPQPSTVAAMTGPYHEYQPTTSIENYTTYDTHVVMTVKERVENAVQRGQDRILLLQKKCNQLQYPSNNSTTQQNQTHDTLLKKMVSEEEEDHDDDATVDTATSTLSSSSRGSPSNRSSLLVTKTCRTIHNEPETNQPFQTTKTRSVECHYDCSPKTIPKEPNPHKNSTMTTTTWEKFYDAQEQFYDAQEQFSNSSSSSSSTRPPPPGNLYYHSSVLQIAWLVLFLTLLLPIGLAYFVDYYYYYNEYPTTLSMEPIMDTIHGRTNNHRRYLQPTTIHF